MALTDISQLKTRLLAANLRKTNAPLYDVLNRLIEATQGVATAVTAITGSTSSTNTPSTLPQTFLTKAIETATLPQSLQVLPGVGIGFTDTPNRRVISATVIPQPQVILSIGGDSGEELGNDGLPGPPGAAIVGQPMGVRVTINVGQIYQATSDGFLTVEYRSTTDSDYADISLLVDIVTPPIQERGGLSINAGLIGITSETTTVLVRNGEYYEVQVNVIAGSPTCNAYFISGGGAGPTGNIGPQGIQGPIGGTGLDGEEGFEPIPLPGLTGATGQTGATGSQGIQGFTGPTYIVPLDGEDGPECIPIPGLTGATGAAGTSAYFITGTGNPQGVQAYPIGTFYVDTNTGYPYHKTGGGSTAYGWYRIPPPGLSGPIEWNVYSGVGGTSTSSGHGPLAGDVGSATWITNNSSTNSKIVNASKTYAQIASAATSGTSTYWTTSLTSYDYLDDDIDLYAQIVTGASLTAIRIWFGMSSAAITNSATLGSASNGAICLKYDTGIPDAGWVGYTCKGSTGNSTTSEVAAIAVSTAYILRVRFVRQGTPTAYFSVNDGTEVSTTTDIPATGNLFFVVLGFTALSNVAYTLAFRVVRAVIGS